MIEITPKQLLEYLEQYGTSVHCEMYINYKQWYFGDVQLRAKFYYDRGCAIVVEEYEHEGKHHIRRSIHQTTPDADIDAVTEKWRVEAVDYAKKFENPEITLLAFTVSNGELPPEKDRFFGWRNYSRSGGKYTTDEYVRELTIKDSEIIQSACKASMENDSRWGKQAADDFLNYDFEYNSGKSRIYGIFNENILVGMAEISHEEPLGLAWLKDILIIQSHRRKGFGKKLLLTILSDYPNIKWHYQAAKQNVESVALAKSLGFTLEGAGLYIMPT